MRAVIGSCLSAIMLAVAALSGAACVVDDGAPDLDAEVPSEESLTTLAASPLSITYTRLGCSGGMASERFTASARGALRYAWYQGDTVDGPWHRVSDGPTVDLLLAPGELTPLRAEACFKSGCRTRDRIHWPTGCR